jgi:hypothetical protein
MAVSISGTTLTFNDATTQTTARTSSNTVTSIVAGTGITVSGATGAVTVNASGSGTVTSVSGTNGLTGTVTTSGSLSVDTTFGNIGTYAAMCLWTRSNVVCGSNVSGSTLGYYSSGNNDQAYPFVSTAVRDGNVQVAGAGSGGYNSTTAPSGTWKAMSGTRKGNYDACQNVSQAWWGLWVRVS